MPPEASPGTVRLVGAGPGAADLLTVRALRAIEGAEALLYDALVSDEVVALAPRTCLKIRTGKRGGGASLKQETINRLMLHLTLKGLRVVRLKGGDPGIFGRVGEESEFLQARGVATEIVPGVTAASAAAAQFGAPLTHRGEARRLVLATARLEAGVAVLDWAGVADPDSTLAIYMGRDVAGSLAAALIARGLAAHTPCLAVENAGRPEARACVADLETLGHVLAAERMTGPTVLLIGRVAARAGQVCVAEAARRAG